VVIIFETLNLLQPGTIKWNNSKRVLSAIEYRSR